MRGCSWPWPTSRATTRGRAALQQAVGEAAGRRADVERPAAGDVDRERVEGGVELLAAASDEARRGPRDDDGVTGRDEPRRLVGDGAVDQHPPGGDRRAGIGAAGGETAPDELGVEAPAGRHSGRRARRRARHRCFALVARLDALLPRLAPHRAMLTGGLGGRQQIDDRREVGDVEGDGHADVIAGPRHARAHERERTAQRHRELAVGARLDRRPRAAAQRASAPTTTAHGVGHRRVRLAGDDRLATRRRGDAGEDRAAARDRPVGRRVRGVVVRRDEARTVEDRRRGDRACARSRTCGGSRPSRRRRRRPPDRRRRRRSRRGGRAPPSIAGPAGDEHPSHPARRARRPPSRTSARRRWPGCRRPPAPPPARRRRPPSCW